MKPKILDFAVSRVDGIDARVHYQYDFHLSLSVVMINGKPEPLIGTETQNMSLATQTRVKGEKDDYQSFAEVGTKTKVKQEGDDFSYLMLNTKTFTTKNEKDD